MRRERANEGISMLRRTAILFCLLSAAPAFAQPKALQPPVVYTGVTVIDGTGASAKPGMAIITRDGRIDSIVPSSQWRKNWAPSLRQRRK